MESTIMMLCPTEALTVETCIRERESGVQEFSPLKWTAEPKGMRHGHR
jgi:hypothetical protein